MGSESGGSGLSPANKTRSGKVLSDLARLRLGVVKAGTVQKELSALRARSLSTGDGCHRGGASRAHPRRTPRAGRTSRSCAKLGSAQARSSDFEFPKFAWRYPLRSAARAAGLEPDRASKVKPYDFRDSVATELTERSGNLLGVGYLLGHRHATTTNQYVHARRRAAESVLWGQHLGPIDGGLEGHWNNPALTLQHHISARDKTRTCMPWGHWNLNPAHLPIPPSSLAV